MGMTQKRKAGRQGWRRKKKLAVMRRPTRYVYRPQGVCNIKRTFWLENWTLGTAATSNFWRYYAFQLSSLPSYTELTALWDRYRLNAIKVTFRPRFDGFGGENTTDTTLPGVTNQAGNYMHVINDPYSNVTPTGVYNSANLNSFLENGNVRSYRGLRPFSVYVKPAIDTYVGTSATAARRRAPFLQTTNFNMVHNGFHIFAQDVNLTGVSGQSFDVFVTYYMTLKGLK